MPLTHIVLVEDERLLRISLEQLLLESGYLVTCFSSGRELIELFEQKSSVIRSWNLVIMDVHLDGDNGLEAQKTIRNLGYKIPFIFMSAQQNARDVNQAWRHGAHNFLFKPFTPDEFLKAINDVVKTRPQKPLSTSPSVSAETIQKFNQLTPRQKEVLKLVAQGFSNTQISVLLSISARTVKMHREAMMHRYGFSHVTDLVRFHDACKELL
jgi:FixJ family two-component response regulator